MKHKNIYIGATFGLMLGAAALAPALPFTGGVTNVYATEGTEVEVDTYADFYDAIVNGDAETVRLAADLTEFNSAITISAERTVTIDLDGHTLSIRNGTARGIVNNGDLTILGGGVIQNSDDESEVTVTGLIDNYGTLTIEDTTLREYGFRSGSTIRNNDDNAVLYFNEGSKLHILRTSSANVGIAVAKGEAFVADGTEFIDLSDNYYPIQVKNGNLTIGTVGSENPATIRSKVASIYSYADGQITINNADVESEERQAIKVSTSEGKITINGGRFSAPYGGVYVFSNTEKEEPIVEINGGDFSGQYGSIVSTNSAGDLKAWAFNITGGTFAGTRIRDYLSEGYSAYRQVNYFENGWTGYTVDEAVNEDIPQTIYMKKGTQSSLGLSATAKKYATLVLDREGIVILDEDTITAGRTGIVKVTTVLNDGTDPVETLVYAYENLLSADFVEPEEFDEADVAALRAGLGETDEEVGFLDVHYARVVDGQEIENLTESETPITVLVNLPELPELAEGYRRTFKMFRYLDGEVEEVSDITVNTTDNTLGFETMNFVPFLVTYTDTEIPADEPEPEPVTPVNPDPTDPENNEEPGKPVVPHDDTFDFDEPGELDPLGVIETKPAATSTQALEEDDMTDASVGVPNTSGSENKASSEIGLLVAMVTGSVVMTTMVLGAKKIYQKK